MKRLVPILVLLVALAAGAVFWLQRGPVQVTTVLPADPEPTAERHATDPERARLGESYERMDVDGDGRVSRAEYSPDGQHEDRFESRDLDGDGYIDAEERRAWHDEHGQTTERFKRWAQVGVTQHDTDGDERLSDAEFPGPPEAFGRLDRNGDGFIERSELKRRSGSGREGGDR
ncbi:MAG: hypothetical protein GY913_15420 [Proteobacteria bacterium]|nr:hypothetical protein [Pseudomonadota bacterium]MCP4918298.1 hypothetical protein [Pseudomonadota bacterium]